MCKILLGIQTIAWALLVITISHPMCVYAANTTQEKEWSFYIDSIDAYVPIKSEPKEKEAPEPTPLLPKRQVYKPDPLPNGATPQQISIYNQQLQKSQRDQQRMELKTKFESIETFRHSPTPVAPDNSDFTLASTNSIVKSGYSVKQTNFDWGGKDPSYNYVDYEFSFESTKVENAKKMTDAISEMSKARWEVDLNRSFQRVEGRDENVKAFTTTQMRFRRRK
jgi:hypothetical protein